jgi:hypothetical protein
MGPLDPIQKHPGIVEYRRYMGIFIQGSNKRFQLAGIDPFKFLVPGPIGNMVVKPEN